MGNCQIIENTHESKSAINEQTDYDECIDIDQQLCPLKVKRSKNTTLLQSASRNLLITSSSTNRSLDKENSQTKIAQNAHSQDTCRSGEASAEEEKKKKTLSELEKCSNRVKIKRPPFQMVAFDYTNFIVKKKTSIWEDFILIKKIGSGSFGSVYMAQDRQTGDVKAIKSISKQNLSEQEFQNLVNEFQILRNMDHPNIIKLYDIYEQQKKLFVVTQLCEGGNLLDLMKKFMLDESAIRNIMTQLLSAVRYMHNQHILHRDIKLDNIVVVGPITMEKVRNLQIKLIDFGISMNLGQQKSTVSQYLYGTLLYMPPQSIKGTISISWDLWSCGIVCYLLATRQFPYTYRNEDELTERILKVNLNRKNLHGLPKDMVLFIMSMLNKRYLMRVTAIQALKDPWLKKRPISFGLSKSVKKQTMINLQKYDAKNNLISVIESYLVTKKINQAQRQHLASIFESIDQDRSGIIEVQEFKKFYQENSEYYDSEEMEELLLILDKNKSGKIDFNEFIAAMCSRRQLFQLESLSDAFDFVDRDCSGQISRDQIQQLLRGIDSSEVEYLFKMLDSDNNNNISKKQFLAYFQNLIKE